MEELGFSITEGSVAGLADALNGSIANLLEAAEDEARGSGGIGTLSEKTLHCALKHFFAPSADLTEVSLRGFVADVFDGKSVTEIQTANFRFLKRKLDAFLPDYPVTVVYPFAAENRIIWIDPKSGEVSKPRVSGKKGSPAAAFAELYHIRDYLLHPNLSVLLLLFDMDEYRMLDGWDKTRKKGASKKERLPRGLSRSMLLHKSPDYRALLDGVTLPDTFTAAELAKAARLRGRTAYSAVNTLRALSLLCECGKRGRAALFRFTDSMSV